jgi:hypothetical protein
VVRDKDASAARLKLDKPQLIVGKLAIETQPALVAKIVAAAKKNPLLRSDAVVVRREGNRVYIAGNNDDAHYYAVATLLNHWGCRWYLPTDFGECIPEVKELKLGELDIATGSPFEVRRYWISWNGSSDGKAEFMHRNFFNEQHVPNGHNLAQYTKDLIPPGKTMFNVPIAEDKTADHVAKQVMPLFKEGKDVQLGMEDGIYESDSPLDKELLALQFDKYFMKPSATDAFMTFYNKVAERLLKESPQSKSRIGFLAYANITIPPVKVKKAAKPLVAYLAPIDIDPIHDMDSPLSAPKREYKEMLYKWAEVMEGRVVIYDYDQGMMVWRDVPAPSVQMFRKDVQHYAKAGILGVDTESRGAFATIFTNLYFRGQLLWNPSADVDALEKQFYVDFFGPAAVPMQSYWQAINKAWAETIVTEHEYHLFPAVYTHALMAELRKQIAAGDAALDALRQKPTRTPNEEKYVQRMAFMRKSFDLLDAYHRMVEAAWINADYPAAVGHGERGLAIREELTKQNDIFTTYKRIGESGAAWWPGEVEQYRELAKLTTGEKGTIIPSLGHEWLFRTDPKNIGLKEGWASAAIEAPRFSGDRLEWQDIQKHQNDWQWVYSSMYLQSQGFVSDDHQPWTGIGWYRNEVLVKEQDLRGKLHLMFPGLFNQCTLFINGEEVAQRKNYNPVWWYNDYKFEWDIDVSGKLKAGQNTIALRIDNPHHMGGMFRKPFLWREK